MMLSDVCRVHPVGGRRVRPAGWMARIGLIGPGSADLVWYGIVEFNVPLDTVCHFGDDNPEQ